MLELRPNCECCDVDLPPASTQAMICTYECTFCRSCVDGMLAGRCPNCGGNTITFGGANDVYANQRQMQHYDATADCSAVQPVLLADRHCTTVRVFELSTVGDV